MQIYSFTDIIQKWNIRGILSDNVFFFQICHECIKIRSLFILCYTILLNVS